MNAPHVPLPSTPALGFSGDWGTSRFRLRLAELATGRILAELATDQGAAPLARDAAPAAERAARFATVLAMQCRALWEQARLPRDTMAPCLLSGMVGSSLGWEQTPYAATPFPLDGSQCVLRPVARLASDAGGPVWIVGGVRAEHDVMRGEECEAMGVLRHPAAAAWRQHCLLLLPGTHTKQLEIRDGAIVAFRTFMTGELFALLRREGVLAHSVLDTPLPGLETRPAFGQGVRLGAETPLLSALFRVRVEQLLQGQSREDGTARLCGLLVGAECAVLRQVRAPIVLAASAKVGANYQAAAAILGITLQSPPPEQLETAVVQAHCHLLQTRLAPPATEANVQSCLP